MSSQDRSFADRIQANQVVLVQCLDVDHPLFWPKLHSENDIISRSLTNLQSGNKQVFEQRREFLEIQQRWPLDSYQKLLKCLVETNQGFLLVILGEDLSRIDSEVGTLTDVQQTNLPLWDKRNLREQCPVTSDPKCKSVIATLLRQLDDLNLEMTKIRPTLLKLQVVDSDRLDLIEHNNTNQTQIYNLIRYVNIGPRHRYHAFIKVLVEHGYTEKLLQFEIDPEVYKDTAVAEAGGTEVSYTIEVDDLVRIDPSIKPAFLEELQHGHGGYVAKMSEYIGRLGKVVEINKSGDYSVVFGQKKWIINPVALSKSDEGLWVGDKVRVMEEKTTVVQMQDGHGEWTDAMDKILGKEGTVAQIFEDGDLRVQFKGDLWTLNPGVCALISKEDRNNKKLIDALKMLQTFEQKSGIVKVEKENLLAAATKGHTQVVRQILVKFPDAANIARENRVPLHLACHEGHKDVVRLLLDAGALLNIQDEEGDTPLGYAIIGGHSDIARMLIEAGADVNKLNNKGIDVLHIAVNKNHLDCVRLLLEAGVDPNNQDQYGDTPLHDAIVKEEDEMTSLLVKQPGFNFGLRNQRGFNVLHHAVLKGYQLATKEIIEMRPGLVDIQKEDGFTALHLAVLNGHIEIAEMLLDKGQANTEITNGKGQTVLAISVFKGEFEMTELLVNHGADVNAVDLDGDTCLHQAIMRIRISALGYAEGNGGGDQKIALLLSKHGANLLQPNKRGETPLQILDDDDEKLKESKKLIIDINKTCATVARKARPQPAISPMASQTNPKDASVDLSTTKRSVSSQDVRNQMLKAMEQLSRTENPGSRATMSAIFQLLGKEVVSEVAADKLPQAAIMGQEVVVQQILECFPNAVDTTMDGRTALQLASAMGHLNIMDMLIRAGADADRADEDGHTALVFALDGNQPDAMRKLLNHGANPNYTDHKCVAILNRAAYIGHTRCFQVLLDCEQTQVNIKDVDGDTALHLAVMNNRSDIVECLLKHPALNLEATNEKGFNALQFAALKDCQHGLELLIQRAPHLVEMKLEGHAPLHIASVNNHVVVATTLIEKGGADLNTVNIRQQTPLSLAVYQGHLDMVEVLLTHGADVNMQDDDGDTALHQAIRRKTLIEHGLKEGHVEVASAIVYALCRHGADLERKNTVQESPLDLISDDSYKDTLRDAQKSPTASGGAPVVKPPVTKKSESSVNAPCATVTPKPQTECTTPPSSKSGGSAGLDLLHDAVANSNDEMLELLLSDTNIESILEQPVDDGLNIFHLSIVYRNQKAIRALLNKLPKFASSTSSNGQTALHLAADLEYQDMVDYLLKEEHFQCDTLNAQSQSAIFLTVNHRNNSIAASLLDHGASINLADCHGDTCLHHLINSQLQSVQTIDEGQLFEKVEFLCSRGADPHLLNHAGQNPLDLVEEGGLRKSLLRAIRPPAKEESNEVLLVNTESSVNADSTAREMVVGPAQVSLSLAGRAMNSTTTKAETETPQPGLPVVDPQKEPAGGGTNIPGVPQSIIAGGITNQTEIKREISSELESGVYSSISSGTSSVSGSSSDNVPPLTSADYNGPTGTASCIPPRATEVQSSQPTIASTDLKSLVPTDIPKLEPVSPQPDVPIGVTTRVIGESCESLKGKSLPYPSTSASIPCIQPLSIGTTGVRRVSPRDDDGVCRVCVEEPADVVFHPCGHKLVCAACIATTPRLTRCLQCRAPIAGRDNLHTLASSIENMMKVLTARLKDHSPPDP